MPWLISKRSSFRCRRKANAFTDTDTEDMLLVIVTDEDGRTGIGECSCAECAEGVARVPHRALLGQRHPRARDRQRPD